MSNYLDPNQDRHFVGPDLGPNCLHKWAAARKKLRFYMYFEPVLKLTISPLESEGGRESFLLYNVSGRTLARTHDPTAAVRGIQITNLS